MNFFTNIPILNIGNKQGATGYIDFLTYEDVKYPLMKGIDSLGRPFIVLKCVGKDEDGNIIKFMQTFFQRYVNDNMWMGCGNKTKLFLETNGGVNYDQFEFLDKLMLGEVFENFPKDLKNKIRWIGPENLVEFKLNEY